MRFGLSIDRAHGLLRAALARWIASNLQPIHFRNANRCSDKLNDLSLRKARPSIGKYVTNGTLFLESPRWSDIQERQACYRVQSREANSLNRMSKGERVYHTKLDSQIAYGLLLLVAMFTAGCGGGSGSTTAGTPLTPSAATALKADAGGVCETLLNGETYTTSPPPLACNQGADPYTAYLDGSGSTAPGGATLSYAWSFASKPTGSDAVLVDENTANPTFVPDKAGQYTVQLVVGANGDSSPRAVALVVALDDATLNPDPTTNPDVTPYSLHGGLSSDCMSCHNTNADPSIQAKSSTHMATSNMCQACHSPIGFNVEGFVDHAEVFGNCGGCHDGVTATGKSANHLVTTQECSDCHNTTSFINLNSDGTFDHTGIMGGCSACHNGIVAIGTTSDLNPSGHPSISVECNACHTTVTFATPFPNHSDPNVVVPNTCGQGGCHDGNSVANSVAIVGKNSAPNPHPDTGNITQACDACHNTTTFNMSGVFDHGVLARHPIACKSCHDGLSATGMTAGHIPIAPTADCSNCHNTSTFVGGFVDHTSPDVTSAQCTDCHDGTHTWSFVDSAGATVTLPIQGTPTTPQVLVDIHAAVTGDSCGKCHGAGGSFSLATVDHSGFGSVGSTTPPSPYTSCSECHDGTVATGQSTGHVPTTQDCVACHDPQRGDWFGVAGFDHSSLSISGNTSAPACTSCHNGSTATGQSLTHVPLPTVGQDCLVCHGTAFTNFVLPTFDHAAAGITNNCARCHDGQAHDGVIVVAKPTGHIPTSADCSTCHADTTNGPGINGSVTSGFTRADLFVDAVHPPYTTGCRSCHNGTYDNATYGAKAHPNDSVHATVDANGWECSACHTTTGNFLETNPVNHQDAAVKGQPCVSCHVAGNATGAIGKGPAHPATSNLCQQCHQAGGSFSAGFDHTTLDVGGVNHGLACSSCHDGRTATGKAVNHVPTARDCIACHAGYPPTASSFAGGTFDHTGPEMTGKLCMQCHNDSVAVGKTNFGTFTHIATSSDCGACHTTLTFANATAFNHTGVTTGCAASGCHASGTASVVDVTDDPNLLPHIPIVGSGTEVNCYACHKSAGGTFANSSMDHSVVTFEACQSCHDGKHDGGNTAHVATTKSSTHFVTSVAACASCHTSTTAWTTVAYKHTSSGGYPGDHSTKKVTSCTQCHSDTIPNANISTFPSTALASDKATPYGTTCAACHANKSDHGKPVPVKYIACGNSGCHKVSSSSF